MFRPTRPDSVDVETVVITICSAIDEDGEIRMDRGGGTVTSVGDQMSLYTVTNQIRGLLI